MFEWFSKLLGGFVTDRAFEAAIYSADTASYFGIYQFKEPDNLHAVAKKVEK